MRVFYFKRDGIMLMVMLAAFLLACGYLALAHLGQAPPGAHPSTDPVKLMPQPYVASNTPDISRQEFFVDCRLDRDRIRSQQIETLKEIADQPNSSSDVRDTAQRDLIDLTATMAKETELESLVMARGFQDAAVLILPRSATVVVQARSVAPAEVDQIRSLVVKTTGLDSSSVFVIPKA
jgi:stage III sporulation protein AH